MTLPKKGSRIIRVGDFNYRWMVSGNDGWIDLFIESETTNGQLLKAKFNYNQSEVKKTDGVGLKQQFVVTPDIVKQIIELGKKEGWLPNKTAKPFDLHPIDDKINWQKINRDIKFCDECSSEYFADTSEMLSLCPDCSHHLYGYVNCEHNIVNGRCKKCYWNGKSSEYIKKLKNDQ
jgi:hypothetical protein